MSDTSLMTSLQDTVATAVQKAAGGLDWIASVLMGEFKDDRDLSAMVADMLLSLIPGIVVVTSARDLIAVTLRLAHKPERREQLGEWMLLISCAIVLVLPVATAAAGAVVGAAGAGIGAVGGAVAGAVGGSELAAVLRAVTLMLIREGVKLAELIGTLQRFLKGNILKLLKEIKFVSYQKPLLTHVNNVLAGLIGMTRRLQDELGKLPSIRWILDLQQKLATWERSFYAMQQAAAVKIPQAVAELDKRLAEVLQQSIPPEAHVAATGVKAEKPVPATTTVAKVEDTVGAPLKVREGQKTGTSIPSPNGNRPGDGKKNVKPKDTVDPRIAVDREKITRLSQEAAEAEKRGDRALAAAKIEEARDILRPHVESKDIKGIVDRLDVTSAKDKAVFWSGDKMAAQEYAKGIGGVTLETTPGGRVIDGWDELGKNFPNWEPPPSPCHRELWETASEKYALGASGEVNVVQTAERAASGGGYIWKNVEKDALEGLKADDVISDIVYHVVGK
jgi:hypothetical protein